MSQEDKSELDKQAKSLIKDLRRRRRELLEDRKRSMEGYKATNTLNSQTLRIRKDSLPALKTRTSEMNHLPSPDHPFYSLWAADSPIFLIDWMGGTEDANLAGEKIRDATATLVYFFTTKKTEAFRMAHCDSYFFNNEAIVMGHKAHGLREGDYCNSFGHKLTGRNLNIAHDLFNKVISGVGIFPFENPRGYVERGIPAEMANTDPRQIRSYGQTFLQELSPNKVVEGEVFVPGNSYRAFFFGNQVVVESDLSGDATYLMDARNFDALRQMPKLEILTDRPAGFLGRILHLEGAEDHWKSRVRNFLGK